MFLMIVLARGYRVWNALWVLARVNSLNRKWTEMVRYLSDGNIAQ